MSKLKLLAGSAIIAGLVALVGCSTTNDAYPAYTPVYPHYGYYGCDRCHYHGGPYYYSDGIAFTNADGTHVESQSGVVPQ